MFDITHAVSRVFASPSIISTNENYVMRIEDDLIENPSPRCACMLVLDTSSSMSGEPIKQLNQGISDFIRIVQRDDVAALSVELGIITFNSTVEEILPFTTVANLRMDSPGLQSGGMTNMGEAVNFALKRLEERKHEYKRNGVPYYQPWLVLISDGAPTDSWQAAANRSRDLSANRKLVCLSVGVGGADLAILSHFSAKPALQLQGLDFGSMFQWLSQSMSRVSASNSTTSGVSLPSVSSWASI